MNWRTSLFLFFTSLFAFSCRETKEIFPEKPNLSAAKYAEIPESFRTKSTVILPIEIPLKALTDKINAQIPKRINLGQDIPCPETPLPQEERCRVEGYINVGNVNLTGNRAKLTANAPISGRVTMRIWYRIDIIIGSDGREDDKNLHFKGNVKIETSPTIDYNLSLKPNLKADVNFSEAYVHFGTKISVRGATRKALLPLIRKNIAEVEKDIYNKYNLKKELQPFWNELHEPVLLSEEYNLWNVFTPTQIHYNEINIENGIIKLGLGIDFNNVTYLGDKPEKSPISPIPNLLKSRSGKSVLDLNLPLVLSYQELNSIIQTQVPKESIYLEEQDATVKINELEMFGDAKAIYIKTHFQAAHKLTDATGVLYFKATPQLKGDTLYLDNLDFDVKTKNLLLNGAEWLMKDKILAEIKKATVINIGEEIQRLKEDLNQQIKILDLGSTAKISGNIDLVSINNLQLSKTGLFIQIGTKGKLSAKVNDITF